MCIYIYINKYRDIEIFRYNIDIDIDTVLAHVFDCFCIFVKLLEIQWGSNKQK